MEQNNNKNKKEKRPPFQVYIRVDIEFFSEEREKKMERGMLNP